MRIEALDTQQPVVGIGILLEKPLGRTKNLILRIIVIRLERFNVKYPLTPVGSFVVWFRRRVRISKRCPPGVSFTSAKKLPGIVPRVIRRPTIFKIVVMIGYQMGMDTMFFEKFGDRVIKWFHWSPVTVEKIVPAGLKLPPCGHTGQAASVAVGESNRSLSESLKIRGFCPRATVGLEHVPIERIKKDVYDSHYLLRTEPIDTTATRQRVAASSL